MDYAAPPPANELPRVLKQGRITSLAPSAYYVPNFLSQQEEALVLEKIASAPKPRWKQLAHRRLQSWPSDLVKDVLMDAPLPSWLDEPVVSRLLSVPVSDDAPASIFASSPHRRPNHVLVNEYLPGAGIMPHKDGPAYHPVVCTVSLGSSLCLGIYRNKDDDGTLDPVPVTRILQEPRSLLVMAGDIYTGHLHGIEDVVEDTDLGPDTVANWPLLGSRDAFAGGSHSRGVRTSLTYRDVLKMSKAGPRLAQRLGGVLPKK